MLHSGRRAVVRASILSTSSFVDNASPCRVPVVGALSLCLLLGREAVADASNRMEVQRRLGIALEALAQPHDEVVERARRRVHLVPPDAVEYLLARDDRPGMLGEHLEDHRLLVGQRVLAAVPRACVIRLEVDAVAAELERARAFGIPAA